MAANVLLVEDEPGIQALLKFNLPQAGHGLMFLKRTLPGVCGICWMVC